MIFDWMRKTRRPPEDNASDTVRANPDVRAVAAADGLAVFDTVHGGVFRSNAVGAEIWRELIEKQGEAGRVADRLAGRFDIPVEQAREDVSRFVDQLRQHRLVTIR